MMRSRPFAEIQDPQLYGPRLRLEAEHFPMGFPLRIATNSRAALAAAARMWSRFPKLFDEIPARICIAVTDASPGGSQAFSKTAPVMRGQEHMFSIVADPANFACADLNSGFGHMFITPAAASDAAYLRYHFLEPLAYILIAARHAAFVHASCIALDGRAVLLCGTSGAGKTCLAYACARRGWTFLSGDAVAAVSGRDDYRIAGRPFEIRFRSTAARLFPELAAFPRSWRPNGKIDIEADPRDLGLSLAVESTANRLVFLDRVNRRPDASICEARLDEARRELQSGVCFGDRSVRDRHGRTLDRLAALPSVRLQYSNFDAAEEALRSLVGTGAER